MPPLLSQAKVAQFVKSKCEPPISQLAMQQHGLLATYFVAFKIFYTFLALFCAPVLLWPSQLACPRAFCSSAPRRVVDIIRPPDCWRNFELWISPTTIGGSHSKAASNTFATNMVEEMNNGGHNRNDHIIGTAMKREVVTMFLLRILLSKHSSFSFFRATNIYQ